MKAAALAAAMATLLTACGGGDDNGPTSGGWIGTTSSNRDLTAVVLPDGNYYLMYSAVGDAATVGGVVQGTGALDGENFSSADGLDFSAEGAGIKQATVAAVLQGGDSFDGTVTQTATSAATTFQTKFDRGSSFLPPSPSLDKLTGAYVGNAGFALGVRPATFTVTSDGTVTSTINGCSISGKATPRTDVNAYDLTIAFGGAPCAIPNLSFAGVAYLRQDNGRLYAAARNAATKQSVIFSGSKG